MFWVFSDAIPCFFTLQLWLCRKENEGKGMSSCE